MPEALIEAISRVLEMLADILPQEAVDALMALIG